jgi:hypothetical protein
VVFPDPGLPVTMMHFGLLFMFLTRFKTFPQG